MENIFELMKGLWIAESKDQFIYIKQAEDNTLWLLYNIGSTERGLRVKAEGELTSDKNIRNNTVIFRPIEEYLSTPSNKNPNLMPIQNQSNYPAFRYTRSSGKLQMIFNGVETSYIKISTQVPTDQLLKFDGDWVLTSKIVIGIRTISDKLARINGLLTRIQFDNNILTYKDNMKIKQIVYNVNNTITFDGQIGTRKI